MSEEYNSEYTDILKSLKDNYLFKLSLGSKELFHSNFLEMLWELDQKMFIWLMRELTEDENLMPDNKIYYLSREKENFDLCIYHEENTKGVNKKPIYDLIIENKVKSIPHHTQLKAYEKKVEKNRGKNKKFQEIPCTYILLSLVEEFSEKQSIENAKPKRWNIVNYSTLKEKIGDIYTEKAIYSLFPTEDKADANEYINIIKKYQEFIQNLHKLQGLISENFLEKPLFDEEAIKEFKRYRLHDLYIKQSCGVFVDKLNQALKSKIKNCPPIYFLSDIKEIDKKECDYETQPCIFFHEEMLNVEGSVGVSIYPEGRNGMDYQIIIQGKQYRHCICKNKSSGENNNTLWDKVRSEDFFNPLKMVKNYNFGGQGRDKKMDCCSYALDKSLFIYKYIPIGNEGLPNTPRELLETMVSDIEKTCQMLGILK